MKVGAGFELGSLAFEAVASVLFEELTTGSTDLEGRDRCRVSLFGTSFTVSALGADRKTSKFLSRAFINSSKVLSGFSLTSPSNPD